METFRKLDIKDVAQGLSVLLALSYFFGFVCVNAYFLGFGISDFEAFNLCYIPSGLLIVTITLIFYFMVGRHVIGIREDHRNLSLAGISEKSPLVWKIFWPFFCLIAVFVDLNFKLFLSAAFVSQVLFSEFNPAFISALTILFLVDYFAESSGLKDKYIAPVTSGLVVGRVVFLYFGLTHFLTVNLILLGLSFLLFSLFANLVAGKREQYGGDESRGAFEIAWTLLLISIFAGGYGKTFYGVTNPIFGGGRPIDISVLLSNEAPAQLKNSLPADDGGWITLKLLGRINDEYIFALPIFPNGQVIRMQRQTVVASRSSGSVGESDKMRALIKQIFP